MLGLKGNQGTLYEGVQESFAEGRASNFKGIVHDSHQTVDGGHGRIEIRRYWTISDAEYLRYLDARGEWEGLKSIGMVEAERQVAGEVTRESRYYLSSLSGKAEEFGRAVRGHWGIENGMHWVLDVAFREDESRVRSGHGAENLAVVRRLALNLIHREKTARMSMKGRRLKAAWSEDYLLQVLTSKSSVI